MTRELELVDIKFVDMYHFQVYEGKFVDLTQEESGNEAKYIYANVSNFETEKFEDSEVRIYAHPYEDLYCAEDYELCNLYLDEELCDYIKTEILKEIGLERQDFIHSSWFATDTYISPNNNVYCLYHFDDAKYLIMDMDMTLEELKNIEDFDKSTSEVLVYWMYGEDYLEDRFKQSVREIIAEYEKEPKEFFKKYNTKGRN